MRRPRRRPSRRGAASRRRSTGTGRRRSWLLLAPPAGWFGVVYLGSLVVLFISAFWYLDPLTSAIKHDFTLQNFEQILTVPVYRTIVLRTVARRRGGHPPRHRARLPDRLLHGPGRSGADAGLLFAAVLLPLWSSYLVRVYAWRTILSVGRARRLALRPVGLPGVSAPQHRDRDGDRLHLPLAALHDPADLRRASSGSRPRSWRPRPTSGARNAITFRRIVLPLALPVVVAGSIFTFSLTLGDYITPQLVSNTQFIGNVVYDSQGVAGNVPFAAAFATVPVLDHGVYLL